MMSYLHINPALWYNMNEKISTRLPCSNVDGMLWAGTPDLHEICSRTHEQFEISTDDLWSCTFSGFQVKTHSTALVIYQDEYVKLLDPLSEDASVWIFEQTV